MSRGANGRAAGRGGLRKEEGKMQKNRNRIYLIILIVLLVCLCVGGFILFSKGGRLGGPAAGGAAGKTAVSAAESPAAGTE